MARQSRRHDREGQAARLDRRAEKGDQGPHRVDREALTSAVARLDAAGRVARQAFLQLLMNFLRGLPCRLLASACFEHSSDFSVRGAWTFLAAAGLSVAAGCA